MSGSFDKIVVMNRFPFFYALHGRWAGGDWFYKIYVTPAALYGAVVAVQFPDAPSAQRPTVPQGIFTEILPTTAATKAVANRRQLETTYDQMDADGLELLTTDERNFCFAASQIQEIRLTSRSHWWTIPLPNSGTMQIQGEQDRKMWFVLYGRQDFSAINSLLCSLTTKVIVTK